MRLILFKPVNKEIVSGPNRYYQDIIAEISDMISSGELQIGDILPSERVLAEKFETSRVPVREALKILEFLGIVGYAPGKGMQVRHVEVSSLLSKVFFAMNTSEDTLEQLLDIRLLLEPYAVKEAAANATEEDLDAILKTLDKTNNLSYTDQSMDFHSAVIHASHNELLEEIYKFLYSLLREYRLISIETRYEDGPFQFHSQIYEAIKTGKGASAEYLMRAHLEAERDNLTSQDNKLPANDNELS